MSDAGGVLMEAFGLVLFVLAWAAAALYAFAATFLLMAAGKAIWRRAW